MTPPAHGETHKNHHRTYPSSLAMDGKYVLHHEYQAAQHVVLLTTKYPDPQGAGCTVARTSAITGSAGSPAASASLAKKNLASSWRAGVSLDCSMKALRIRFSAACEKKPQAVKTKK